MSGRISIVGLLVLGVMSLLREPCRAQQSSDLGNNAALQYYAAFLQMQDADLSDADVKELSDIIAGARSYDEAKFGKLIDDNAQAIETMLVGSSLPQCDWGLTLLAEKFGPSTPVPYFWRSRALGRLDILYALHAWGKGDRDEAVRALAGGLKFARDISKGGPLVPALVAKMLIVQQLSVANRLADSGKLTAAQKRSLSETLADLGPDGIDWQQAAQAEMRGIKLTLDQFRSAHDQRQYFRLVWKKDAPGEFHGITRQDYIDASNIVSAYGQMLRTDDPEPVKHAISAASFIVQTMVPNPEKALKSKQELRKALEESRAKLR